MASSSAQLTLGRPPCSGTEDHAEYPSANPVQELQKGNGDHQQHQPHDHDHDHPHHLPHLRMQLHIQHGLNALEEEHHKIEAFKRELPHCMQLLNKEIEALKKQLSELQHQALHITQEDPFIKTFFKTRTSLENFMASRNPPMDFISGSTLGLKEKKEFEQTDTHLWNHPEANGQLMISSMTENLFKRRLFPTNIGLEHGEAKPKFSSHNNGGGAFSPFSKDTKPASSLCELIKLSSSVDTDASNRAESGTSSASTETPNDPSLLTNNICEQAPQRKPRRCWSLELHHRFVNALQQLGGSDVATPKQIREVMQVDGLTNDEVKSHLQKYRLHTKRPNSSFNPAIAAHAPQLVVLGGIWVPPVPPADASGRGEGASDHTPAPQPPYNITAPTTIPPRAWRDPQCRLPTDAAPPTLS